MSFVKNTYYKLENKYYDKEYFGESNSKILYIHIPKTGGTSIEQALESNNMYLPYNYDLLLGKQLCRSLYHEPLYNLNINFNDYICFVTVRKPFDRFISNVKWINHEMKGKNIVKITTLEETINELEEINEANKSLFETDCHYVKQVKYLYDIYGNKCPNIIRMENMQEDMDRFFKKYGLNPIKIERYNSTQDKEDIELTKDQKLIIYKYYKEDFDFFIREGIYTVEELGLDNLYNTLEDYDIQIPVYIITVDKNKIPYLREKFNFLNPTIQLFPKARNYRNSSDGNAAVKKSIRENTQFIISKAKKENFSHVLIIQDDCSFLIKPAKVLKTLKNVKKFIEHTNVDLFALGSHPNCEFKKTHNKNIVKFSYFIHWHSVIFKTDIILEKPRKSWMSNDTYMANHKIKKNIIEAYGLRKPITIQLPNTTWRREEYKYYKLRYSWPYGDPKDLDPLYIVASISITYTNNYIFHTQIIKIFIFCI